MSRLSTKQRRAARRRNVGRRPVTAAECRDRERQERDRRRPEVEELRAAFETAFLDPLVKLVMVKLEEIRPILLEAEFRD